MQDTGPEKIIQIIIIIWNRKKRKADSGHSRIDPFAYSIILFNWYNIWIQFNSNLFHYYFHLIPLWIMLDIDLELFYGNVCRWMDLSMHKWIKINNNSKLKYSIEIIMIMMMRMRMMKFLIIMKKKLDIWKRMETYWSNLEMIILIKII